MNQQQSMFDGTHSVADKYGNYTRIEQGDNYKTFHAGSVNAKSQDGKLLAYLKEGKKATSLETAHELSIAHINSIIRNLKNPGVLISENIVKKYDADGNYITRYKEWWLSEFDYKFKKGEK